MASGASDRVVQIREGLRKTIKREGFGELPNAGDEVRVHYTGTLDDGTEFDSSRSRGVPFKFTLGAREVILGWDLGVATMRKGERALLHCSSDYAYGDRGAGTVIPPKATLTFDVELLEASPPSPYRAALVGVLQCAAVAALMYAALKFSR